MGWSNEIPNPLVVGGAGTSGAVIVVDANGNLLASLDDQGVTALQFRTGVGETDNRIVISAIGPNSGSRIHFAPPGGGDESEEAAFISGESSGTMMEILAQGGSTGSQPFQSELFLNANDQVSVFGSAGVLGVSDVTLGQRDGTTDNTLFIDANGATFGANSLADPITVFNGPDPIDSPKMWREIKFFNVGDFSNAAFADWLTGWTSIPVPVWARGGTSVADITCLSQGDLITAATTVNLRIVAGSTNGPTSTVRGAAGTQFAALAAHSYTIPAATTAIAVKLQAQIAAGSAIRGSAAVNMVATMEAVISA